MRKFTALLVLMVLMVSFSACSGSTETELEECRLQLSEMPLLGLDFNGMRVEDVQDRPFSGSLAGEAMIFNEGTMLLSRYESSEVASELLTPDNALSAFGEDAEIVVNPPIIFGDQTVWIQRTNSIGVDIDSAIVRYGNYLLLADPNDRTFAVEGMLDTFDRVLQDYIDDHPECAYLHTETR